jgi:hypothetical protein
VLDATGLLYYYARMYDPNLARFTSADSIVPGAASGAGSDTATLGVDSVSQHAAAQRGANIQESGARIHDCTARGEGAQRTRDARQRILGEILHGACPERVEGFSMTVTHDDRQHSAMLF